MDLGHDGQTFAQADSSNYAKNVDSDAMVTQPGEDIDARPNGMMAGVFEDFHASVGYKPVQDQGADAQTFYQASDLYQAVAPKKWSGETAETSSSLRN